MQMSECNDFLSNGAKYQDVISHIFNFFFFLTEWFLDISFPAGFPTLKLFHFFYGTTRKKKSVDFVQALFMIILFSKIVS